MDVPTQELDEPVPSDSQPDGPDDRSTQELGDSDSQLDDQSSRPFEDPFEYPIGRPVTPFQLPG